MGMLIYDISRTVSPKLGVWPEDTHYSLRWTMRMNAGHSVNVSTITLSAHSGAHTDAPYHFDDAGLTIDRVPLEKYVGPATVIRLSNRPRVEISDLERLDFRRVPRVLFKTEASGLADDIFPIDFTHLSPEAADFLGRQGVVLVGTDAPSMDAFDSKTLPAHKTLLRYGVAILEGIDLSQVPEGDYELIALPLKLKDCDSSPVRAILRK